jgi:hypothetical protein
MLPRAARPAHPPVHSIQEKKPHHDSLTLDKLLCLELVLIKLGVAFLERGERDRFVAQLITASPISATTKPFGELSFLQSGVRLGKPQNEFNIRQYMNRAYICC